MPPLDEPLGPSGTVAGPPRRRAGHALQAGGGAGRALLPEPVPRRDELARLPDHLSRGPRTPTSGGGARVPARRRRRLARGAPSALQLRDAVRAVAVRLPRLLGELRVGADRPLRDAGALGPAAASRGAIAAASAGGLRRAADGLQSRAARSLRPRDPDVLARGADPPTRPRPPPPPPPP